jgi:hypothetical protein
MVNFLLVKTVHEKQHGMNSHTRQIKEENWGNLLNRVALRKNIGNNRTEKITKEL